MADKDIDIPKDPILDTINVAILASTIYDDLSRGWQQNEGLLEPRASMESVGFGGR